MVSDLWVDQGRRSPFLLMPVTYELIMAKPKEEKDGFIPSFWRRMTSRVRLLMHMRYDRRLSRVASISLPFFSDTIFLSNSSSCACLLPRYTLLTLWTFLIRVIWFLEGSPRSSAGYAHLMRVVTMMLVVDAGKRPVARICQSLLRAAVQGRPASEAAAYPPIDVTTDSE